jgi:NAD(P)-dependent dehydrogenase (short-subunit alcohol dehydrogenase family)
MAGESAGNDLEGRVAVVAGGSMGFGEKIAERLIADGVSVVIAARDRERLESTAKRLGASPFVCDIAESESVRALADEAVSRFGRLDIAVNSAGYQDRAPFAELEPERVERMIAVQLTGALYFIQHMAVAMGRTEPRGGSIIGISSLTATLVAEGYAPYAAAKAGLNHATKIAASEFGPSGVRVNVVSPTIIRTPMTDAIFSRPGMEAATIAETPLGRIGEIDDVVGVVRFLASDEAGFITGENIHIDGGTALRRLPRREDYARHAREAMENKE